MKSRHGHFIVIRNLSWIGWLFTARTIKRPIINIKEINKEVSSSVRRCLISQIANKVTLINSTSIIKYSVPVDILLKLESLKR